MDEKTSARLRGLLGLARRAGRVEFGFDAVLEAFAKGRAAAAFLARDTSERTAEHVRARAGRLPVTALPLTREELGRAIGRGATAAVAVTDAGFARQITELAGAAPRTEEDHS